MVIDPKTSTIQEGIDYVLKTYKRYSAALNIVADMKEVAGMWLPNSRALNPTWQYWNEVRNELSAQLDAILDRNDKMQALKEKRQAELADGKGEHTPYPIFIVYEKGTYCVDGDNDMMQTPSVFGYEPRDMAVSEDGDCEIYLDETELEENADGYYYDEESEILYNRFVKECYYDKVATFTFTREGAEAYIKSNRHNLRSPRIYVDHIPARNLEVREILRLLGDK